MLRDSIKRSLRALITRVNSARRSTSKSSMQCMRHAQLAEARACLCTAKEDEFRERASAALRAKVSQSYSVVHKMFECPRCKSTYFDTKQSLVNHMYVKHDIIPEVWDREHGLSSSVVTDLPATVMVNYEQASTKLGSTTSGTTEGVRGPGLPTEDAARKRLKLFTYLMEYFPDAFIAEVEVAVRGNEQHNPGQPLHWAREKSNDQMNTALRHQFDYGRGIKKDTDGQYHLAKAIWRLKAQLQLDIEEERRNENA